MTDRVRILFPVTVSSVSLAEEIFEAVTRNLIADMKVGYNTHGAFRGF